MAEFEAVPNEEELADGPVEEGSTLVSQDASTMTQPSQEDSDIYGITHRTPFTDLVLRVEDRLLYTSRNVMALASPVWKQMLTGDFRFITHFSIDKL